MIVSDSKLSTCW